MARQTDPSSPLKEFSDQLGKQPLFSQRQAFRRIVTAYRQTRELTLRDFAAALSEHPSASFSYQTIKNWEDDATQPNVLELVALTVLYHDWRMEFAGDCLAALRPRIFKPIGEIGRRLLPTSEAAPAA